MGCGEWGVERGVWREGCGEWDVESGVWGGGGWDVKMNSTCCPLEEWERKGGEE